MTVEFDKLWFGHPINESIMAPCIAPKTLTNLEGKVVQRGLPVFSNQCAIRMGVALKRAGCTENQFPGVLTCGVHPRSEMHFIRAHELANGINRARLPGVGEREIFKGEQAADYYNQIFGRTGMIYIQDYWHRSTDNPNSPSGDHIDVWNGYRSTAKWLMEWFFWLGHYSNYAGAREIWFWEVE